MNLIASTAIEPKNYFTEEIYQAEIKDVFQRNWIFVGFKEQLANHNDFITFELSGLPVVVQNFQGELSALLNICSHRKARLQTEESGNRALRCPYHCWSFKKNGELGTVPKNKTDFGIEDQDKDKFSLKKFELDSVGDFIFVRLSPGGSSLEEFLGPYHPVLKELSEYFGDQVHQGKYHWDTNWKLAVETVLEVYHVPGTHPESFTKLARPENEVISNPPHTTGNTPLQDTPKKWWAGVRKHLKLKQNPNYTEYNHFFIYPNLAIGLTNGSLMSVQTYEPLNKLQTNLNFRLRMVNRVDGKPSPEALKNAVKQNFIDFNHQTLEEDRVVAESCQKNMPFTDTPGVIGACEARIRHFHDAWRNDMTDS